MPREGMSRAVSESGRERARVERQAMGALRGRREREAKAFPCLTLEKRPRPPSA